MEEGRTLVLRRETLTTAGILLAPSILRLNNLPQDKCMLPGFKGTGKKRILGNQYLLYLKGIIYIVQHRYNSL